MVRSPKIDQWSSRSCIRERTLQRLRSHYLYITPKSVLARLAHTALKPTASINGHGAFPKIDRWSSRSHIRERTLRR
ncbi:MAG: hypothetical protein GPJ15_24135 [Microcystis aeruginosa G11-06]|nr:hypothetical protein [Microcystis aeruginosa G11-06]